MVAGHERKSGAQRRREIADAALTIIGERGLPELTTANLAAVVGVSTGALFRHFKTLGDVMDFATDLAVERIADTFPPADLPPLDRLTTLARRRIELLSAEPGIAWLLQSDQAPLVVPATAVEKLKAMAQRSRKFLLETLADGIADGTIRGDIAPEHLLLPVIGTIHALIRAPSVRSHPHAHVAAALDGPLAALVTLLSPTISSPAPTVVSPLQSKPATGAGSRKPSKRRGTS